LNERVSILDQWRSLSRSGRATVIFVIAAFFIFLFALEADNNDQQKAILRDQFHLPATIAFSDFKPSSKKNSTRLQGSVRFSEREYQSYVASFADPNIWRAVPLRYRGVTAIGEYSRDAFRWSDTKPPLRFGSDGMARFGIYEDPRLDQVENALHFCYAVVRSQTAPADAEPGYAAVSCGELEPRADPAAVVQGVLDPTTRTLYMRI
jgi:hypothetical protein